MDRIQCSCKNCGSMLGEFTNQWMQLGETYYSPTIHPSTPMNIRPEGDIREGEVDTLVDGWFVKAWSKNY